MSAECLESCPDAMVLRDLEGREVTFCALGQLMMEQQQQALKKDSVGCPGPAVIDVEVPVTPPIWRRLFMSDDEIETRIEQQIVCGRKVPKTEETSLPAA